MSLDKMFNMDFSCDPDQSEGSVVVLLMILSEKVNHSMRIPVYLRNQCLLDRINRNVGVKLPIY